ncbi:Macrophage mannose receptor 1 [Liparis tanakae]|uniref:Macrophage mannose receptor 1 n=1 Tax=Liparis tanakae TaxID=230148 RepID=A0A4Z2F625_9TELE|nr:Macrophage mannose receptor 1 [Liparis tanakae]
MKSGPGAQDLLTFSLLLVAARCVDAFTIRMTVHCPPEKLNWAEARRYCQENYRDLVTLDLVNSVDVAQALTSAGVGQAWIGLHRDPEDDRVWKYINLTKLSYSWYSYTWYDSKRLCARYQSSDLVTLTSSSYLLLMRGWIGLYRSSIDSWKWISGNPSEYRNWGPREPITKDCGIFYSGTSKWHSNVCSEDHRFACYDDNVVVVTENKTWEDALSHCRGMQSPCEDNLNTCRYRYELLSLEQPSDYNYVRSRLFKAETDEVWTSLRFLGGEWFWVDGTKLEDDGKLPDCPSPGEYCGTLSRNETNDWTIRNCSELRNFICYKEKYNPTLL